MIKTVKRILLSILIISIFLLLTFSILTHLYPRKYAEYVTEFSKEYSLNENLVYAIIKCESNFKHSSLSHAEAYGLMQITASTFEWAKKLRKEDDKISIYDPRTNIDYGCYIFSYLYNEFSNTETALAAYNAGRGKVKSWLSNPEYSADNKTLTNIPFSETKNYIQKVKNTKLIYDLLYRGK